MKRARNLALVFIAFFILIQPRTVSFADDSNLEWWEEPCECIACGKMHENQYMYDLDGFGSPYLLCNDCRKEIILSGKNLGLEKYEDTLEDLPGFLRWLHDYEVFNKGFFTMLLPPNYMITEEDTNSIDILGKDDDGDYYTIYIEWNDAYKAISASEGRAAYCFTSFADQNPESYAKEIERFNPFQDNSCTTSTIENEDAFYFIYQNPNGLTAFTTMENGILYILMGRLVPADDSPKDKDLIQALQEFEILDLTHEICYPSLKELNQ